MKYFLFVTLFGIGKLKKIPGSYASLITTVFLFVLFHILNFSPNIVLTGIIIIFFISLYAVNRFIKNMDNKDPKEIVIDEKVINDNADVQLIFGENEKLKKQNSK